MGAVLREDHTEFIIVKSLVGATIFNKLVGMLESCINYRMGAMEAVQSRISDLFRGCTSNLKFTLQDIICDTSMPESKRVGFHSFSTILSSNQALQSSNIRSCLTYKVGRGPPLVARDRILPGLLAWPRCQKS